MDEHPINRKRWPELSQRLMVGSGYPLGNCGKKGNHDPHIVKTGDHQVWGRIFAPYHCDGNLPREIFDKTLGPPYWTRMRRNGYPGIPAID